MHRLVIILTIPFIAKSVTGQATTYKEADSISYAFYMDEKWEELVKFSKSATEEGIDYYYFNVRVGVACFKTGRYGLAEKYLLKAIKNNKTDFAQQYLFWTYRLTGETTKADKVYGQLSDEAMKTLGYKRKVMEYVYFEGGLKRPGTEEKKPVYYGGISLGHRLWGNAHMEHEVSSYYYKSSSFKTEQIQYSLNINLPVKQGVLGIGGQYASATESAILSLNSSYQKYLGKSTYGGYLEYSKRFKRAGTNFFLNYLGDKSDSSFVNSTQTNGTSPPVLQEQTDSYFNGSIISGFDLYFTPRQFGEKLTLGIENYLVLSNNNGEHVYKTYLNISPAQRIGINLSYLHKGNARFYDKTSDVLYTDSAYEVNRFDATLRMYLSTKTTLGLTYSLEKNKNKNINERTTINSLFIGVLFKF